jgi:hypothetical protein
VARIMRRGRVALDGNGRAPEPSRGLS